VCCICVRRELGASWTIHRYFPDMHEDPDLDRYLTDPRNFRR
jgi:hypothetical protein